LLFQFDDALWNRYEKVPDIIGASRSKLEATKMPMYNIPINIINARKAPKAPPKEPYDNATLPLK
jgi:hypothetical protein